MRMMMAVMAMGLFGCSFEGNQYSPEQVISNALEDTTGPEAYYAESEMTISEKGEIVEQSVIKEWRSDDGKIRIDTEGKDGKDKAIVVNDGKKFTMYQEDQNQALISEDPELFSFSPPSLKEQAGLLLEMIEDTHTISIEGEEEIVDRMTYHLVAKANKDNTLLGDMEIWIDKENWMALKTISNTGDSELEMVYTKIDFESKISPEIFTLDLPEGVEIQDLEEMNDVTEVTIEEAAGNIEKPILYFTEKDGLEIEKIEMTEMQGELNRKEVSIDYTKDGLPLFMLAVFESPEESTEDDISIPGEETVTIRGLEGSTMELSDFRSLLWQENGVNYSVVLIDPNFSFDEFIDMTTDMELVE